jgi:hypothetical protein
LNFLVFTKNEKTKTSFSIGKLLDLATNPNSDKLFGLELWQFYTALGGVGMPLLFLWFFFALLPHTSAY